MESLPAKTVVFAYGRFNPPSAEHQLLVHFVKTLAARSRADHVIFAAHDCDSKKNPLSAGRRVHHLRLMFPGVNFAEGTSDTSNLIQTARSLNQRYRNLILVACGDRVAEYTKILNKYNNSEYRFDSIQVVSACATDPDDECATLRMHAAKGDFESFRKALPPTREIDARRLMNDVREGMGMEPIKEQIRLNVDALRERYFRAEIYNVGDIVESLSGEKFEIIKRGTNHLLVKDSAGKVQSKWIHEVFEENNNE